MNDAHSDLSVPCHNETDEINEWGNNEMCDNILTYDEHFVGLVNKRDWEGDGLKLKCDECGNGKVVCPVCHGGGWYKGESTGKQLACHVCNTRRYQEQVRQENGY